MTADCRDCGQPTTRSLGAIWLCDKHADAILDPIRARVVQRESLSGVGRRVGLDRIDHGRHAAELGCTSCTATWVGIPGEACPWCEARLADVTERQRKIDARRAKAVRHAA